MFIVDFSRTLASAGKELKDNFLRALAEREEANRSGKNHVSTLLQHFVHNLTGFPPQNISPIPSGQEQNLHCVKQGMAERTHTHAHNFLSTPHHTISHSS